DRSALLPGCLLRRPRPLSSPLVPYTTLFRSIVQVPVYLSTHTELVPVELQLRTIAMDFWASTEHKLSYKYRRNLPAPPGPVRYGDRKSTRLNSSHVSISYAVCCLKKKKRRSR